MIPYTTPDLTFTVPGDLSSYEVYIDIVQQDSYAVAAAALRLAVDPSDLSVSGGETTIHVQPTQAQTGVFHAGTAKVQANWVGSGNTRGACDVGTLTIGEQLRQEVVAYVGT